MYSGEEGTPYNGLYGDTPPEMGYFFRLQVYEIVGISLVEVYSANISFVCISLGNELLNRRKSCMRNAICQQRFNSKKKAERYDR